MVTVLREGPLRVAIYPPPKEHGPPHVHVVRDDDEVLIDLGDEDTGLSIREVRGMHRRDVRRALEVVARNRVMLLAQWSVLHGG